MNEWERRRRAESNEWKTSKEVLNELSQLNLIVMKNLVDDLQKWSDRNPRETNSKKVIQLLEENNLKIPYISCPSANPFCVYRKRDQDGCEKRNEYWKGVYEEE